MSATKQSIPELYREAAEQVRQLARRSRLTDVRGDLLALSASYERMTSYAEAAIRLGVPGYPLGEILPSPNAQRLLERRRRGLLRPAVKFIKPRFPLFFSCGQRGFGHSN